MYHLSLHSFIHSLMQYHYRHNALLRSKTEKRLVMTFPGWQGDHWAQRNQPQQSNTGHSYFMAKPSCQTHVTIVGRWAPYFVSSDLTATKNIMHNWDFLVQLGDKKPQDTTVKQTPTCLHKYGENALMQFHHQKWVLKIYARQTERLHHLTWNDTVS